MQSCQVCGTSFDPLEFQVIVPELGRGFDRVECARTARALALPGSGLAAAPLVAIVEPLDGSVTPVLASGLAIRHVGAPIATLGLLAAGTAAAVFLWLRVVGGDTTSFPFSRAGAPPAFGDETVQAQVEPGSTAKAPHSPASRPTPEPITALIAARRGPSATPARSGPSSVARPVRLPAAEPSAPAGQNTGNGHAKKGEGHIKHGDSLGTHTPGHGKSKGKGKH